MITSGQVKAGRGILGWSQTELSEKANLSLPTIKRMESIPGELRGQPENVKSVKMALGNAGIIFIPADAHGGPGIRLKK